MFIKITNVGELKRFIAPLTDECSISPVFLEFNIDKQGYGNIIVKLPNKPASSDEK